MFDQFNRKCNRLAHGMKSLCVKKEDRVAILGFNSIEWMEVYFAASKIGAVPTNVNPRFVLDEVRYILEDSDAVVAFVEEPYAEIIAETWPRLPMLKNIVVYGVGKPPEKVPDGMLAFEEILSDDESNPKIKVYNLGAIAATTVFLPTPHPFIAREFWETIEKHKVHTAVIVGDEGTVSEDGKFNLIGRGGNYVINTGGEKVYSEEVEEIIKSHPKVWDVAVIGIPDPRWGQAVTALVELEAGKSCTEEEIVEWCRKRMAGYKRPRHVVFVDKVPRSASGKIDRAIAQKLIAEKLDRA